MIEIAIVVGAAIASLSCTPTTPAIQRTDLVGEYKFEESTTTRDAGLQTISLSSDGTYQQRFVPVHGTPELNTGTWELVADGPDTYVKVGGLRAFGSDVWRQRLESPDRKRDARLPVDRWNGRVRVATSEDAGQYFVKE